MNVDVKQKTSQKYNLGTLQKPKLSKYDNLGMKIDNKKTMKTSNQPRITHK